MTLSYNYDISSHHFCFLSHESFSTKLSSRLFHSIHKQTDLRYIRYNGYNMWSDCKNSKQMSVLSCDSAARRQVFIGFHWRLTEGQQFSGSQECFSTDFKSSCLFLRNEMNPNYRS